MTTVMGGIFVSREQTTNDRTPMLHRIPFLGWLFKRDTQVDESREAVWRRMARATGGGEWPNIEPVSPRQKSSSRLPSISVMVAPLALSTRIGNGVGQSFIQCIGTPPKKPGSPLPIFAADFGRALRKTSASVSRSLATRPLLMPPIEVLEWSIECMRPSRRPL